MIGPAVGWDLLLDKIVTREAEIEAGIDGQTVRRILERLATRVRTSQDGLGPLSPDSIIQAFSDICGYSPDERGMVLLQRLPGLGVCLEGDNSRTFIDEDFADACRAGDLLAFIESPFDFDPSVLADIVSPVGGLGIEVASLKVREKFSEGKVNAALVAAQRSSSKYMAGDLVRLMLDIGFKIFQQIRIDGLFLKEIELSTLEEDFSNIQFRDCFFLRVEIDPTADVSKIPSFHQCYIEELAGRVSRIDVPQEKIDDTSEIERFSETVETTAAVLTLDLPLGIRVCLTILKKLYEQSGTARKENALHRGLDSHARRLVPDVLRVLQSEGLAFQDRVRGTTLWRPDRSKRARVGKIIAAPSLSDDFVLQQCGDL